MNKLLSIQTIFGLTDKLSGPMRQINDTVGKFRERTKAATVAGKLFDRGMTDAYRPLGAFGRAAEAAHRSQSLMVRGLSTSWGVLGGTTAKLTALAGSIGAVYGAQKLVRGVIDTGARFEMLQAQLDTSFKGDLQSSKRVLSDMVAMAKSTPFEIEGLTQSFLTLKNFGIDPYSGALKAIIEQSSALGAKTETLDAITRELGQAWARGKLQGDGIRTLVQNSVPIMEMLSKATGVSADKIDKLSEAGMLNRDVMRKLFSVMEEQNRGAAERAMKTYTGLVSMVSDSWTTLMKSIADAGAFSAVKSSLSEFEQWFSRFLGSQGGAKFVQRISDGMVKAIDVLSDAFKRLAAGDARGMLAGLRGEFEGLARQANLAGVWTDMRDALSGLAGVARVVRTVFGGIESTLDRITGNGTRAMAWIVGMQVAARAFLGVGLGTALAGIGKVLITVAGLASGWGAAVLAVGAAAGTVVAQWEPLKAWFTGFMDRQRQGFAAMRDDLFGAFESVKTKILGVFDALGERLTSFVTQARDTLRGLWDAMGSSDGTEFGVPKALRQSFRVSPSAPPGYSDFIGRMGGEFGVRGDLLRTIFGRESSAGANAGFNTTDSNAKKGTPSFGPFQFIEPTFNRFHKAASAARPDVFARLGQRDWQNWHQQAAVAAWAFANGKARHWSTYKGEPIREPREYRLGRGEQSVRVENEITIIQDDRRQRVMTKTGGDGGQKTRVNVGKNRFGIARGVA